MTTLVYKDGVLAADTRLGGSMKYPIRICKVTRVVRENGDVSLIAATGSMPYIRELEDWVISNPRKGDQPSHDKAENGLVMEVVRDPKGCIDLFVYLGDTPDFWTTELAEGEIFCTGSGADYAYGYLADESKTAVQAVIAASKYDTGTNNQVYYVNFDEDEVWEWVPG